MLPMSPVVLFRTLHGAGPHSSGQSPSCAGPWDGCFLVGAGGRELLASRPTARPARLRLSGVPEADLFVQW